jgi:hypothetical protein
MPSFPTKKKTKKKGEGRGGGGSLIVEGGNSKTPTEVAPSAKKN